MDTIFKDIILVICDFLDDMEKLSFLSVNNFNHLLKSQTKFTGPIDLNANLWYINSFYHFYAEQNLLEKTTDNLHRCKHLTLINNYFLDDLSTCISNDKIIYVHTPNITYLTYKYFLIINSFDYSYINLLLPPTILLHHINNNIIVNFELVFKSDSGNIIMKNDISINIKSILSDQFKDDDEKIVKYIQTFNSILIVKDKLELNKKYVIRQKK